MRTHNKNYDFYVQQIIITNDDKHAIAVMKNDVEHSIIVRMYHLNSKKHIKDMEIVLMPNDKEVRACEVTQDSKGKVFCLPYYDSGKFKIRVFNNKNNCLREFIDINNRMKISNNQ